MHALQVNSRTSCKMPTKQRLWQKLSETSFYRQDFCLDIFLLIFLMKIIVSIKFPTSFSEHYPSRNAFLLALLCRAQTVIQMSRNKAVGQERKQTNRPPPHATGFSTTTQPSACTSCVMLNHSRALTHRENKIPNC